MYKYHSMDHLKDSINMVPFYNAQLDDIKLNLKIMLSKNCPATCPVDEQRRDDFELGM